MIRIRQYRISIVLTSVTYISFWRIFETVLLLLLLAEATVLFFGMCFEQKQANVAFLALRPFTQDQERPLFESFLVYITRHIHFPIYEINLRKSNGIRSDSFFLDLKTQKLSARSIASSAGLK